MKTKPVTPYARLLEDFKAFARNVKYRRTKSMCSYPKAKLDEGWRLSDLYERTAAAQQIGYDVVLSATDDGLVVQYVQKAPDAPWQVRP